MSEQIDLTTTDQAAPGTSSYHIVRLDLNFEAKSIGIGLIGENGERKEISYGEDAGAVALMRALNKANLSTKSLHRRIMEKLIADGHLAGTISGAPE